MPAAFDPELADFSGMTGARNLHLGAVVHKAFVSVDEAGTEGAAATAVVTVADDAESWPTASFRADHPFLFLLRDVRTGAILFLGQVADPR